MKHHPKQKTCWRCDGKRWFGSAIGLIACQQCDGTGKDGVDVEWLIKDWQRLKEMEATQTHHQQTDDTNIPSDAACGPRPGTE